MTDTYMPRLFEFLEEVRDNNNREWFAANRDRYNLLREAWLADIDRLVAAMSRHNPAMSRQTARTSVYRFNRDTRFSPDKSPYKTFFSASLSPWGRDGEHAGCYVQVGTNPDDMGLWAGLYCPTTPMLRKMRNAIIDNIEEWDEVTDTPEINRLFPGWCGRALKTAPKGWPKDHPRVELLRLQDYGKFNPCDRAFFCDPSWPEIAAERFALLQPMIDFINYSLYEE